jgi:predicted DNA-binding transcriptional regulator YafY
VKRLERLTAMALFLGARRRVRASEVAEQFGVSLRTVYRDMASLVEAGFPVEGSAGDGYRLPQESYLRPLALSPEEAEALALAARSLATTVRPPLREALTRASIKLEAVLDRPTRRRVLELQSRIAVAEGLPRQAGPTTEILEALRERRVARINYQPPRGGPSSQREIEPLGLVCVGADWWLVAYCRLREDARAFRVDGITSWTPTGATHEPRPGLSFADVVARDRHLAPDLFGP